MTHLVVSLSEGIFLRVQTNEKYPLHLCFFFCRYVIKSTSKSQQTSLDDVDDNNDVITAVDYQKQQTSTAASGSNSSCGRRRRVCESRNVQHLQMGVVSFCKAFPWHFIMDRKLELVQLGAGFTRLFTRDVLCQQGTAASTYFHFHRPRGLVLTFPEIVKRANTPFVLLIRKPNGVQEFPAEVYLLI